MHLDQKLPCILLTKAACPTQRSLLYPDYYVTQNLSGTVLSSSPDETLADHHFPLYPWCQRGVRSLLHSYYSFRVRQSCQAGGQPCWKQNMSSRQLYIIYRLRLRNHQRNCRLDIRAHSNLDTYGKRSLPAIEDQRQPHHGSWGHRKCLECSSHGVSRRPPRFPERHSSQSYAPQSFFPSLWY